MTGGSSSSRSSTRFPRGLLLAMLEFRMLNQPFPVGVTMSLFSFVFFCKRGQKQDRSAVAQQVSGCRNIHHDQLTQRRLHHTSKGSTILHLKLFRTACISLLRAPRKDGGKDGPKKHPTVCSFNSVVFLEWQCDGIWCEGARYCCTPSCPT